MIAALTIVLVIAAIVLLLPAILTWLVLRAVIRGVDQAHNTCGG
jgi:hypothetical protein